MWATVDARTRYLRPRCACGHPHAWPWRRGGAQGAWGVQAWCRWRVVAFRHNDDPVHGRAWCRHITDARRVGGESGRMRHDVNDDLGHSNDDELRLQIHRWWGEDGQGSAIATRGDGEQDDSKGRRWSTARCAAEGCRLVGLYGHTGGLWPVIGLLICYKKSGDLWQT